MKDRINSLTLKNQELKHNAKMQEVIPEELLNCIYTWLNKNPEWGFTFINPQIIAQQFHLSNAKHTQIIDHLKTSNRYKEIDVKIGEEKYTVYAMRLSNDMQDCAFKL